MCGSTAAVLLVAMSGATLATEFETETGTDVESLVAWLLVLFCSVGACISASQVATSDRVCEARTLPDVLRSSNVDKVLLQVDLYENVVVQPV